MQTCKDLQLSMFVNPMDRMSDDDPVEIVHMVIPSGTYVKCISGRNTKRINREYVIIPWKGISDKHQKVIKNGVIVSYKDVKGYLI